MASRLDKKGSESKTGADSGENEVNELAVSKKGTQKDRKMVTGVECLIRC